MTFGLIVNLITRGRPDILARTIETTLANITRADTLLMVSIDEDDDATRQMLFSRFGKISDVEPTGEKGHIHVSIKPREDAIGDKYNRMMAIDGKVYCNESDYCSFVTPGFDQVILDAAAFFPDGIGTVVNPLRNASFSDIYAVTRKMIDLVGFYFPSCFPYWFVDHWADDLMRLTGRYAMAPVEIAYDRHGKPMTQGLREPAWWATFFDAAYLLRRQQAAKVIEQLDDPEWRKQATVSGWPNVEYRSRWINANVRASAREMELASRLPKPDERYLRIKAAAQDMVPGLIAPMGEKERIEYQNALLPPTTIVNFPRAAWPQAVA